jgi:dTDP-4-amino-4,6-dideoxygalactose transaminase
MSPSELPAILGGRAIRPEGPPVWPPANAEVAAAVEAAAAAGAWGQYHGKQVVGLEAELAAFHNVPHVITCASGTIAVEAALRTLRVGPGDEVVLAAYDFESNFLTVHAIGARPVLVDVAAGNWNLDPANLEAAFTPQTKAVICSHLHGGIVPMREVMAIARRHGVGVVEDAAQAPGAKAQGRPAGTWGDVGTLSFGGSKLLCSGRGGALLFRDPQLHQRAKLWLHRGLQQWAPLSELQAAALRPQLRKLSERTLERFARVQTLLAMLQETGVPGLVPFRNAAVECVPAFYKVGFQYDAAAFGLSRDLFVRAMRGEGIAFDPGFQGLHVHRSSSRFRAVGDLPHATAADAGCVILHHPVLWGSPADVRQVADAVERVYRHRESILQSRA